MTTNVIESIKAYVKEVTIPPALADNNNLLLKPEEVVTFVQKTLEIENDDYKEKTFTMREIKTITSKRTRLARFFSSFISIYIGLYSDIKVTSDNIKRAANVVNASSKNIKESNFDDNVADLEVVYKAYLGAAKKYVNEINKYNRLMSSYTYVINNLKYGQLVDPINKKRKIQYKTELLNVDANLGDAKATGDLSDAILKHLANLRRINVEYVNVDSFADDIKMDTENRKKKGTNRAGTSGRGAGRVEDEELEWKATWEWNFIDEELQAYKDVLWPVNNDSIMKSIKSGYGGIITEEEQAQITTQISYVKNACMFAQMFPKKHNLRGEKFVSSRMFMDVLSDLVGENKLTKQQAIEIIRGFSDEKVQIVNIFNHLLTYKQASHNSIADRYARKKREREETEDGPPLKK